MVQGDGSSDWKGRKRRCREGDREVDRGQTIKPAHEEGMVQISRDFFSMRCAEDDEFWEYW
jgi:hypothetical protein